MDIGIVGLGHLGKIHLKLLNEINGFNVSAIFDIDKTAMIACNKQYQVKMADSYDELLDLCEAVCVVTPTPTHFELASLAIKSGKHVFIEKPATDDLGDTKKLLKLAREADVKVQVGHVERFNPAFIAAKDYIKDPLLFEIQRLACYNKRGTDVSVILDLMIHDIDLVLSIVKSKIKRISSTGSCIVSTTPDFANTRIEFENGCIANLTANRVAFKNLREMRVFEKNTFTSIDLLNKSAGVHKIQPLSTKHNGILIDTGDNCQKYEILQLHPVIQPINAIKTELEFFHQSIIQNTDVAVSLMDAETALFVAKEIESQIP